jgi:glycosyltransferase involved in cell wall biosynthesis
MRIFYLTRLFSGLESSFNNKIWNPTGVPTIYKVIERLDKNNEVRFLFTAKDSGVGSFSLWTESKDIDSEIKGLRHKIKILAGINYFPLWVPRKLSLIIREFRQFFVILIELIKYKPELIYCDHSNALVAALLSRFFKNTPVVFRLMGVYPFMRYALYSKKIIHLMYRWAYHSPFSLVICTQDGSGVEFWLKDALKPEVRREVLINGVTTTLSFPKLLHAQLELVKFKSEIEKKNIVLIVGKLEKYKGCTLVVNSMIDVLKLPQNNAHMLVIGVGNEKENLLNLVKSNNSENNFTFIDRLYHDQVLAAHRLSDVYISMNSLGNLSNANLEAIQSNDCMIIPKPKFEIGIDVITSKLLKDSVLTIQQDDKAELTKTLYDLLKSPNKRRALSQKLKERKSSFLWSWDERIDKEMSMLNDLVSAQKERH